MGLSKDAGRSRNGEVEGAGQRSQRQPPVGEFLAELRPPVRPQLEPFPAQILLANLAPDRKGGHAGPATAGTTTHRAQINNLHWPVLDSGRPRPRTPCPYTPARHRCSARRHAGRRAGRRGPGRRAPRPAAAAAAKRRPRRHPADRRELVQMPTHIRQTISLYCIICFISHGILLFTAWAGRRCVGLAPIHRGPNPREWACDHIS